MSGAQGSRTGKVTDPDRDDGGSFVKEASDDEDEGTPMDKQSSKARPLRMLSDIRTTGRFDNGIRPETIAEDSALQLDRNVNQLLSGSRTPVEKKSLFGTPVKEVALGNQSHTVIFSDQSCSQLGYVNNCEEVRVCACVRVCVL